MTHTPLAEATSAITQALTLGWIVPRIHWICPICSTTLAITDPKDPPHFDTPCERCGEDLSPWDPLDLPQQAFYHTLSSDLEGFRL